MADDALQLRRDNGIATFVIRIRMEDAGTSEQGWVAHVTDVFEQSERYVRNLKDLTDFMEGQLSRMGIGPPLPRKDTAGPREVGLDP